jgi:hypothetical protein
MAVMSFLTIAIEFAGPEWAIERQHHDGLPGRLIRLVESQAEGNREFAMYDRTQLVYTLTADETDRLLHLLERVVIGAPWEASYGLDGTNFALRLRGPMSEAAFHWWGQVPKGWESIGAVFDHVISLADRFGLSRLW